MGKWEKAELGSQVMGRGTRLGNAENVEGSNNK